MGASLPRRALQLGLRNRVLERYGREWVLGIEDISEFVREQATLVKSGRTDELVTPVEEIYLPADENAVERLELECGSK